MKEPEEPLNDSDPVPCATGWINDEDEKDSDEDANTRAKSLVDDIIAETESE